MKKTLRAWFPSLLSFGAGLALLAAAFLGDYRPEVCGMVGGLLLLQPTIEWSIARRFTDFTLRSNIQADSFDTVWGGVRDTLTKHGSQLATLEGEVAALRKDVDPIKAAAERVALRPPLLPKP